MRLYQRDLRTERMTFVTHLPPLLRSVVVCFYILLGIGVTGLGAYSLQLWKNSQRTKALLEELSIATEQHEMLNSVAERLHKRRELVSDIQAWLRSRFDLEAIYHHSVSFVPGDMLLQSLSVKYLPAKSTLDLHIAVEGDSRTYSAYFRALTAYFATTPEIKLADIQIDTRPNGALLSIEVLIDGWSPATLPEFTQSDIE